MISGYVVGDAEVVQKLDSIDARLKRELRSGIGRATLQLQRQVKQDKLSGQVLKVRTGTLRHSITQAVKASGETVSGIVSTAVKYAPFHEYGLSKTVTVREHVRDVVQSFREVTRKGVTSRKAELLHMNKGTVRAHTRNVDYPAHSFLRSALRELEASGMIREEIDAAISRAIA